LVWLLAGAASCRTSDPCGPSSVAATVQGEPITCGDVDALVARVKTAGGSMKVREALIDLVWQEAERKRLGLPGGERAAESRRKVVAAHRGRVLAGDAKKLRSDPDAMPPGTQLSACGRRLMGQ
jgi:hypothetical protein